MSNIKQAVDAYTSFLRNTEEQHKRTIAEAHAQLEALIALTEKEVAPPTIAVGQAVWITDNEGERLLLLNEAAAAQINDLFDGFQEVIKLLAKKETE